MPLRGALRKKIREREREDSPQGDFTKKKEELQRKKEELRREEERLTQEEREKPEKREKVEPVRIIYHEGKGDWILDILTIVFIVGAFLNSGVSLGPISTALDFTAMQTWLLFSILLQLIKIGKKV